MVSTASISPPPAPSTVSLKAALRSASAPPAQPASTPEAPGFNTSPYQPRTPAEPHKPVEGVTAWRSSDLDPSDWEYHLSPADVAEIDSAVAAVKARGLDIQAVTKADFTLPTLGAKLDHIHQETINGIGFKVVRGLPVDRYSIEDAALAFWGLGTYFGAAMSQNKVGHLLGHVRDIGNDPAHPLSRPYTTRLPQPYHNDNSDIVALLCLKTAKSGGASSWCSSHTVHNEVLRRRPDLYKVLTEPIYQDRKDEIPAGKKPYYAMSVFHHYQGYLTVAGASFVEVVHRHEGVPPLSSIQREALDFLQEVAAEEGVRIDSVLQPGDISICNNVSVWHSRTAFEDHKEQDRKRHMLRLWLASPIGWPLPDIYEERWGSTEVGNRGFINCPGFTPNVSLDPFEAHLQRIAATAKAA